MIRRLFTSFEQYVGEVPLDLMLLIQSDIVDSVTTLSINSKNNELLARLMELDAVIDADTEKRKELIKEIVGSIK